MVLLVKIKNERENRMRTLIFSFLIAASLFTNSLVAKEQQAQTSVQTAEYGDTFKQSINACPGGVVFNIYSFNYEYLLAENHGLVARVDFESHTEKYSKGKVSADGLAFTFNYRYHFSGALESIFVGSYLRYRFYEGDGTSDGDKFTFEMPEYTFGVNAGKRWVWDNGFNMNFSLGYGISTSETKIGDGNSSTKGIIDKFEDDYTFLSPFLGEFSIGYAF